MSLTVFHTELVGGVSIEELTQCKWCREDVLHMYVVQVGHNYERVVLCDECIDRFKHGIGAPPPTRRDRCRTMLRVILASCAPQLLGDESVIAIIVSMLADEY